MCEKAAGEKLACQMKMEKLAPLPLTLPFSLPPPPNSALFSPSLAREANFILLLVLWQTIIIIVIIVIIKRLLALHSNFCANFYPPPPLFHPFPSLLQLLTLAQSFVFFFFVFLYFCAISSRVCVHSGRFFFFFCCSDSGWKTARGSILP